MKLTDSQLGRIARECGKDTFGMAVLEYVLDDEWERAVSYAATGEDNETPLMRVLREVGEEVADAKAHADRQCVVTAWGAMATQRRGELLYESHMWLAAHGLMHNGKPTYRIPRRDGRKVA